MERQSEFNQENFDIHKAVKTYHRKLERLDTRILAYALLIIDEMVSRKWKERL